MGEFIVPISAISPFLHRSADPFDLIARQSHRINIEAMPEIKLREHMARPYPGKAYDLLMIDVPSSYKQGAVQDGEEPPHGMLRVTAYGRQKGYDIGILDAHRLKLLPKEIAEQVKRTGAKAVGLNPTSVNVPEAIEIADLCHQMGIPVILGGIHATLNPVHAREDFPHAAAIVRGDGEVVIAEVLDAIHKNGTQTRDRGVYYYGHPHEGRADYAPKLPPELMPHIDQALLVEEPIYRHEVRIDGKIVTINEGTLFASTGCPFECKFCSSPVMVNRGKSKPYSRPEMGHILNEIQHVISIGADAIHFLDDMAFVTEEHIQDLYRGLQERDLLGKFIWRGLTRAPVIEKFSLETMRMMKETGVWKIALGVESGSDDILKQIKKKVTSRQVVAAVQKLTQYGIASKGFFIMGFPGETEEQILQTRELMMLLRDYGMTEASVFQFKPYPGTESYSDLVRDNPDIVDRLSYLRRRMHRETETGLVGKAHERAATTVWLPDDLQIAAISSGVVREHVMSALSEFYGSMPSSLKEECV